MFEDFWSIYPHHGARSKRAMAKAKWNAITGPGLDTNVRDSEGNSMRLNLKATPERIVGAAKAYRMSLSQDDMRYAPGAQVWLNQGRFDDYDATQLEEASKRWDRIQQVMVKMNLKVVV